ncbi:hypothetical protein J6X15_03530 [Candidatus Saccharibacteria bacterium]|nr:hypothetical protein [Candidatus Saccharibacteria bacterium]
MDAQSLHNHIQSSTKQRIHAKSVDDPLKTQSFKNEEAIKSELHKEEFDHDGDGMVSLMEELDSIDSVKEVAEKAAEKINADTKKPDLEDDNSDQPEDEIPHAAILTMHEEKRPSLNAFSSHHASAPVPQQNRHAPVEEAKPVKDNTNAIIMILLIAILVIAVAIFAIIVLGERRKDSEVGSQIRETLNITKEDEETEKEETKKFDYDFSALVGKWEIVGGEKSCLEVSAESIVSWHQKCDSKDGDYYSGEAKIVSGQDAVDQLGITVERASRMVGVTESKISVSDVFAITIIPDEYVIGGSTSAKKPNEIKLLVVKTQDGEINVYNYHYGELSIYSVDK